MNNLRKAMELVVYIFFRLASNQHENNQVFEQAAQ